MRHDPVLNPARELLTSKGLHETYWGQKIIAAELNHGFRPEERTQAGNWQTCACGQQDARIWRWPDGPPMDNMLRRLGEIFYINVCEHQPLSAAITLVNIERRAAEVLAKQE